MPMAAQCQPSSEEAAAPWAWGQLPSADWPLLQAPLAQLLVLLVPLLALQVLLVLLHSQLAPPVPWTQVRKGPRQSRDFHPHPCPLAWTWPLRAKGKTPRPWAGPKSGYST